MNPIESALTTVFFAGCACWALAWVIWKVAERRVAKKLAAHERAQQRRREWELHTKRLGQAPVSILPPRPTWTAADVHRVPVQWGLTITCLRVRPDLEDYVRQAIADGRLLEVQPGYVASVDVLAREAAGAAYGGRQ